MHVLSLYFILSFVKSSDSRLRFLKSIQSEIKNEIEGKNIICFDDEKTIFLHKITFFKSDLILNSEKIFYQMIGNKQKMIMNVQDPNLTSLDDINRWLATKVKDFDPEALHVFSWDLKSLYDVILRGVLGNLDDFYKNNLIKHLTLNNISKVKMWNRRLEYQIGSYNPNILYTEFIFNRCQLIYKFIYRDKRYLLVLRLSQMETTEYLQMFYDFYFHSFKIRDKKIKDFTKENLMNFKVLIYNLETSVYLSCIYNVSDIFKPNNYNLKPLDLSYRISQKNEANEISNILIKEDITFMEHKQVFSSLENLMQIIIVFNLLRGGGYLRKMILNSLDNNSLERYHVFMSILEELGIISSSFLHVHLYLHSIFDFPIIHSINQFLVDDILRKIISITSASKIKKYKHLLIYLYLFLCKDNDFNIQELLIGIKELFSVMKLKYEPWFLIREFNVLFLSVLQPNEFIYVLSSITSYQVVKIDKKIFEKGIKSLFDIMDETFNDA